MSVLDTAVDCDPPLLRTRVVKLFAHGDLWKSVGRSDGAHADVPGVRPRTGPKGTGVSDDAVVALRAGQVVLLPTDTVYGLAVDACRGAPARRLYRLKNRPETEPIALVAGEFDAILDAVPEARGRAAVAARALLPGPYTLVLPNPARRFRWLCATTPEAIGIRVPELPQEAQAVVEPLGFVAATSANLHGGTDPARVEDVPREILDGCGAVVDAGGLPGTPSTVVDLTGPEPVVLREGAVSAQDALDAATAALA